MNLQELVLWSGVTVSVSMFIITIVLRVEEIVTKPVGVVLLVISILTMMFSILAAAYTSYNKSNYR